MLKDPVPLAEISRALVIKLRHHGDVLLAAPVLRALKTHAPNAEIDALVYEDTAEMLAGHPALARLHAVGRGWRNEDYLARLVLEKELFDALRARRYGLIVHLSEQPRGAWLARALAPRYSVAPATPGRGAFWRKSFTHLYALARNGHRHKVEENLDALRRIGLQPAPEERRVEFVPGAAAEARVASLLAGEGVREREFIHLHPASRWSFKCWPAEKNAELIDRLSAKFRVVLTAAPEQGEKAFVEEIISKTKNKPLSLAGQLSIKELGALTGRARVFVGVDSMPMHLAAAMGTPTVALFGPSGEDEWGPWGVAHRVVAMNAFTCRPCGNDGCGGGKISECLTTLPVAQVEAAVNDLLAINTQVPCA
ncbi:MAG TPA: putative lipopolysaccharide heptosyltransferase III [Burkholderiales bacterium]|jgi:heptosyltransferase-3|nr:putative lipopolysaccharide heptosyltransferase III [Burkholderiales bacterium]